MASVALTTTPPAPAGTGLKSPTGILAVFGVLLGSAGPIVTALEANGWSWQRTVSVGLGGTVFASLSAAFKMLHDKGIHVASLQAAGNDVAQALPQLKVDIATFLGAHPQIQADLTGLEQRFQAFENTVPDVAAAKAMIEAEVRRIIAERFAPPTPSPLAAAPASVPVPGS